MKFDRIYKKIVQQQNQYIESIKNKTYISESILGGIFGGILEMPMKLVQNVIKMPTDVLSSIFKGSDKLSDQQKKKIEQIARNAVKHKEDTEKIGSKVDGISDEQLQKFGTWFQNKYPQTANMFKDTSSNFMKGIVVSTASAIKSFIPGIGTQQIASRKSLRGKTYISESILGNIFGGLTGGVLGGLVNGIGGAVSNVLSIPGNAVGGILKTFNGLTGNQKQGMQQMAQQALANQKATAQVGAKADNVSNIQADKKWLMKMFPKLKDKIKDAPPDVIKGLMISAAAMLKNKAEGKNGDDAGDNDDDADNADNANDGEENIYDQDQIDDLLEDYDEAKGDKDKKALKLILRKLRNRRNKLKSLFEKIKNRKRKKKLQELLKYLQTEYAKRRSKPVRKSTGDSQSSSGNAKPDSTTGGKQTTTSGDKQASTDTGKDKVPSGSVVYKGKDNRGLNKFSTLRDILFKLKKEKGIELTIDELKKYNPSLKDKKETDQIGLTSINIPEK